MPDSFGPEYMMRNMFFREAEQGPSAQELATMTAPFMGSPEQARALYQSPEVQARLAHFGLGGFDPNQIRQSPFLPNRVMQGHPLLGGALTGAMANVAATPEAPLVSGAGSGMSRAAQGMYGGPELLRQYQVRQLMAPFQAMGMQLPIMAEQRRQQLLGDIEEYMKARERAGGEDAERKFQLEMAKLQQRGEQEKPVVTPWGYLSHEPGQPAQPAGPMGPVQPRSALDQIIAPQLFSGQGGFQAPITPAQPATPGGYVPHVLDPAMLEAERAAAIARETDAQAQQRYGAGALSSARAEEQTQETTAGMPGARVAAEKGLGAQREAKAAETRYKSTPQYKISQELGKSDQYFNQARQKIDDRYNALITSVGADTAQGQKLEQQRQNEISAAVANYLVRIQHSGGQITSEQQNWLDQYQRGAGALPAQVSPGATGAPTKPSAGQVGGAQVGGAGAQQSQGTAVNPYLQPVPAKPTTQPNAPVNPYQ